MWVQEVLSHGGILDEWGKTEDSVQRRTLMPAILLGAVSFAERVRGAPLARAKPRLDTPQPVALLRRGWCPPVFGATIGPWRLR